MREPTFDLRVSQQKPSYGRREKQFSSKAGISKLLLDLNGEIFCFQINYQNLLEKLENVLREEEEKRNFTR